MNEYAVSSGAMGLAAHAKPTSARGIEQGEHTPLTTAIIHQEDLLKKLENTLGNMHEKMHHLLHPNQKASNGIGQVSESTQVAPVVAVINRNNAAIEEAIMKLHYLIERLC